MADFYIYFHYKLNDIIPFYVGRGLRRRAYSKHRRNKHWHNIVNKYGYRIEIAYENLSKEDADCHEREFIKRFGRADLGCGPLVNMTDGGDGLHGHSDETRKKMSSRMKGNKFSLERKPWNKGIPMREETKQKSSKSHKGQKTSIGYKHSKNSLKKLSESHIGHTVSESTRSKLSEATRLYWARKKGEIL